MSQSLWSTDELDLLIDDFWTGVTQCLERIWDDPNAFSPEKIGSKEAATKRLEQQLEELQPGFYDDLAANCESNPTIADLPENHLNIIVDGLSLREMFRLRNALQEDYEVETGHGFAVCPTRTRFACQRAFGASAPSSVARDDFAYIGEDDELPALPHQETAYVWTRNPDSKIEKYAEGQFEVDSVERIVDEAIDLVKTILDNAQQDSFFITSDHGYLHWRGNNPFIDAITDATKQKLQREFRGDVGTSRYIETRSEGWIFDLEDKDVIHKAGAHYVVKRPVRFNPHTQRRIVHGGLSLMECLIPKLTITPR